MDVREKLVEMIRHEVVPYFAERIADHLVSHGVTVQEWFSVSDPPKERGCYLVTVRRWLDEKPVVREAYWNGADWLSCYRRGVEITPSVTHWMPLPEPPKEGEE
jgi:hypothetical protein